MFGSMTLIVAAALVLIACLVALLVFSGGCTKSTPATDEYPGKLRDLAAHFKDVMDKDVPCHILVADITGTQDFFQFSGDEDGVELSHPLITERHNPNCPQALEPFYDEPSGGDLWIAILPAAQKMWPQIAWRSLSGCIQ